MLNALASLDVTRRARDEAPVFATFAPAHVLRGGTIPDDLRAELLEMADRCEVKGEGAIAHDLRLTLRHILQCSSNQAFLGVFTRAVQTGVITIEQQKDYEKRLAVNTCHPKGGVCAFNGTGNSCRHIVSALGLVHPQLEFLIEPPTFEQVDEAVKALFAVCNDPDYSVSSLVVKNIENAVRVHSAMGGSSNLILHLISAVIYAGYRFDLKHYDRIRRQVPVPDLFDYSLTEGRDIFEYAKQCCDGRIDGIGTILYELRCNKIPIAENAPTMAGFTWKKRIRNKKRVSADNVKENPIALSKPRRAISGIDVLTGNFFETAIVKISGMPDEQLDQFDEKAAVVVYFENEEEATANLLNVNLLDSIYAKTRLSREAFIQIHHHNSGGRDASVERLKSKKALFQRLIDDEVLRIAVIIAGQGPEAFGMPEMFTPMIHINHNQVLKKFTTLISDGRYSGVSYGAAVGHVTPEAFRKGGILYLQTGDLLHLRLRKRRIDLLDPDAFNKGKMVSSKIDLAKERSRLGEKRLKRMEKRRKTIDPSNWICDCTDAAHGIVPQIVWDRVVAYKNKR